MTYSLGGGTTPTKMIGSVGEENMGLWNVVKAQLPCLLTINIVIFSAVLIGVLAVMIWPATSQTILSPKSPCESSAHAYTLPTTKFFMHSITIPFTLNFLSY